MSLSATPLQRKVRIKPMHFLPANIPISLILQQHGNNSTHPHARVPRDQQPLPHEQQHGHGYQGHFDDTADGVTDKDTMDSQAQAEANGKLSLWCEWFSFCKSWRPLEGFSSVARMLQRVRFILIAAEDGFTTRNQLIRQRIILNLNLFSTLSVRAVRTRTFYLC